MSSAKEIELEIKLRLVSFPDYLKLLGFLGSPDRELTQLNAFYDDRDRTLKAQGWALRVRAQDDRGLITLKNMGTHDRGLSVRREIESEIDRGLAQEIISGSAGLLDQAVEPVRFAREELSIVHLDKLLQFQNERQSRDFRIGDYDYVLELDKTTFLDGSADYELEVELDRRDQYDVVIDRLRRMFTSLAVDFHYQHESKFARALQRAALV